MISIKQRILRYLIEHKEKTFSINEISKNIKIDYKLVHTNVNKLEKERSIKVEDFGNTRRCSFINAFNEEVYITEDQRKKDILKNKDLSLIYNSLKEINKQFIVLLFGSQVKGTATKHSDIDLLIVSDKEVEKEVGNKLRLFSYNIHLTPISYEGFIRMNKSKEFTIVSEAVKKNIILVGIEDYYGLLKNAQ